MKIARGSYKNRGIALYVMATLLLSALVFSLNNVSSSMVVYGANDNNNNEVNNHSLINNISSQIVNSNAGTDKEQVRHVLQQIQTQIAQTAGEDEAANALDQISSIIRLNPKGALAQSLLFLAKQQAEGNANAVTQAAIKVAARISNGDDDLGKSFAQDVEQSLGAQYGKSSASHTPSSSLSSPSSPVLPSLAGRSPTSGEQEELIHDGDIGRRTTTIPSESDQSRMEGIGEEPDTDENEANALDRGGEARTLANNIVIPDDTPFKSNECDGSLDKFVPNPFIQTIGSTRFLVGDCITVVGKVIWTHYINTDGDANFNVKLDSKYNSLLTPANNSPKFNGAIHVEVVCQGPNKSTDPVKINQCKSPKYDGPIFRLPPVGTRVQVTGTYLLDVNEGGHAEIHPAYSIIFNPTSPPSPSPPPTPTPIPADNSLIADAGHSRPDQTVNVGSQVMLDGRQSRNPNVDPITFAWTQMSGPPVQISTPNQATASFTAPSNLQADTTMTFILTVTNSTGLSDRDTVSILVRHGAIAKGTPFQAGYDHGCSDAKLPFSKRYINQPGKGPQFHTQEFMSGYNAGFSACST
ncbi:MAG: PKD domain-containing protein [Nitrososphaeraceae archaeon]